MKWVLLFIAAMFVAVLIFAPFAIIKRHTAESDCADAGGVAIKSYLGPLVCVSRDALIPESEWRS